MTNHRSTPLMPIRKAQRPTLSAALCCALIALMAAASLPALADADESINYQKIIAEKGPALVTVKFVLKITMGGMMGGGEHENESEVTGVMIDPKGLVLCSNTQLGGFTGMMRRFMGRSSGMTATPTDLKILVGDDTEGVDAELLARDSELDLAWVRIKEPGDKPYPFIDLSGGPKPEIGQRIVAIRRTGKYFARTPMASEGRIAGLTAKPRDLYIPNGDVAAAHGLPVYLPDGRILGVIIQQIPESDDSDSGPGAMIGMMSGMQDMMAGLILPAADVAKATARAKDTAKSE